MAGPSSKYCIWLFCQGHGSAAVGRAITLSGVVNVWRREKLWTFLSEGFVLRCHTEWQTEDDQKCVCVSVYLSALKCSKQSIRGNRQMTGPFMIVGTEAPIHDCAVVMRRRADVSAYEYDIVLSVPWIWESSLYWLPCLDGDNRVHQKKTKKKRKCNVFVLKRVQSAH